MSINPFDLFRNLTEKTNYCPDDMKNQSWMVNNIFSMDTKLVFIADEVNRMQNISDQMRYDFYYFLLPKNKYFVKYIKKEKENKNFEEDITQIMKKFQVNRKRATEYYNLLNKIPF